VFVDGDQIDYRLREISENLHRAELTAQERAEQIAEWTELVEQKAKVGQLVQPGGKQPTEKGISKAARELGLDRDQVRRARKIASITPEAKEAAEITIPQDPMDFGQRHSRGRLTPHPAV
jgi:ParB family chromosome partitioning protein